MPPLAWALALWLAAGLTALSAWAVRVYATSELARGADWTSWLVWQLGRGLIWLGVLLMAGGVFGFAAAAVWRALGAS